MGILALIAEFENNIRRERQMEALSDKSKRTCEGCWSETFRPPVDDTRPGRQCGSVRPKALRKTTWDISSDTSQANSGMASGSPNHHLDWLGYCVGDRPGTPPLASNRELIGVNSRWLRIFGQRTRQRLLRRDFTSLTMPRRRLRIIARRLKPIYSDNARFLDLLHGLNGLDGYACIPDRTRRAVACRIGG